MVRSQGCARGVRSPPRPEGGQASTHLEGGVSWAKDTGDVASGVADREDAVGGAGDTVKTEGFGVSGGGEVPPRDVYVALIRFPGR